MNYYKMGKLRIIFMGTPDFAVATLSLLAENGYNIVAVITAPDRPAGRGRRLQESAVKKFAKEKNLTVLQPTNLKNESFLQVLQALQCDLQIVVAFRMLPRQVWNMPKYGTFNLHASLLPQYRGAAPINWAIMNGETKTGVTTFFIDDKIDTGEIILQDETKILDTDDAGSLHDRLMHLGAALVLKTVQRIEDGDIQRKPQKEITALKMAPKIYKDTCRIDWNKPMHEIYNHIRGLSPYPTAWSTLHDQKKEFPIKVHAAAIRKENHSMEIGAVLHTKTEILVAVQAGYIELLEMQFPGKRRMKAKEILNGLTFSKNAQMV